MMGSIFALTSAFFWASAVILFKKSGEVFSPVSLNIYKNFVALILISLTMLILNIPFFPDKPINDWLLLAVSGFLGITLADLFFFMSLNRLNAGLFAIVECLYLPSVIFFLFIFLGENLNTGAIIRHYDWLSFHNLYGHRYCHHQRITGTYRCLLGNACQVNSRNHIPVYHCIMPPQTQTIFQRTQIFKGMADCPSRICYGKLSGNALLDGRDEIYNSIPGSDTEPDVHDFYLYCFQTKEKYYFFYD